MRPLLTTFLSAFIASTAAAAPSQAPRGSYQFVAPDKSSQPVSYASGESEAVIYLNNIGGLFIPGTNDARMNTSSLIDDPTWIPPFLGSTSEWDELVACVEDQFSGFRVTITDSDPGFVPHYEAVVAGDPSDLDQADHIGGLSPFRLDCGVIDNSVVFVFAELFGDETDRLCDVVAQEIAHSFGLDHQMNCDDPMSYLGGCGIKRFRNEEAECGEYEARPCACGQETQNSKKVLGKYLGDSLAPELDIASPAPDAMINPNFYVDVRAEDNIGIERVELWVDGEQVSSQALRPFIFEFTGQLPDGAHDIEVRVFDSENTTSKSIAVTVDADAEMQPPPPVQKLGGRIQPLSNVRGGCSATGSPSNGSLIALALLGFFALLGRRRRALAKR